MKFQNFKIGIRLAIGFGIVLVLVAIMAFANVASMSKIQKNFDENIQITDVKIDALHNLRQVIMVAIVTGRNIALLTDPAAIDVENKKLAEARAQYGTLFEKISGMATPDEKAILDKVTRTRSEAVEAQKKASALSKAFETEAAITMTINEVQPLQKKTMEAIEELIAHISAKAALANAEAASANAVARSFTLVMSVLAMVIGGVLAWFVSHGITTQMKKAVEVARRVADGDLTAQIHVESCDETGQLMQALKDMNESLLKTVSEVHRATDTIATASSQIASGNLDLSSRTEEQASSLEETASSMHELTSTVKRNADHAKEANTLAATASEVAVRGGAVVSQVVDRMGAINQSARQIADIIGVIDGIAFQTNILALNAAVEAARAGEQGRGFAVVASEVRNLAQRSATAAKEIKELISTSVNEVAAGSALVEQAGATMDEVVASVKKVTEIITEITSASREQSDGIGQVNIAIEQMDEVTQQNAALVEEAAAAADSLRNQAENLQHTVSVFRTGTHEMPSSIAVPASIVPLNASPHPRPTLVPRQKLRKVANGAPVVTANDSWEEF